MRYLTGVFLVYLLTLTACSDFETLPTRTDEINKLNLKIAAGINDSASWTSTPEDIAKHLFPPISHDEGSRHYEINKKVNNLLNCKVTILEEGAFDDELLGLRHALTFEFIEGKWKITQLVSARKRRL